MLEIDFFLFLKGLPRFYFAVIVVVWGVDEFLVHEIEELCGCLWIDFGLLCVIVLELMVGGGELRVFECDLYV